MFNAFSIGSLAKRRLALLIVGLACTSTGCASMNLGSFTPTDDAPPAPDRRPKCLVEFRAENKEPERVFVPLEGSMTVNDAIEKSEATKRFNGIRVSLHRKNEQGQPIKLKLDYDRGQRRIDPLKDYALFPNDVIIVEKDTRNIFTDAIDSLTDSNVMFR